jgi:hypothetical protein
MKTVEEGKTYDVESGPWNSKRASNVIHIPIDDGLFHEQIWMSVVQISEMHASVSWRQSALYFSPFRHDGIADKAAMNKLNYAEKNSYN